MIDKTGCLAIFLLIIALMAISFLITGVLLAIACWAFGWTFSWKVALGVYAIICLLSMIFGGSSK